RTALAAASALRPVVEWSELAEAGVDSLVDATALAAYAENLLDAVLARPDAADLVISLRAFLTHNGHIGPAADSLGVHRNTLRNRLSTAEELLGRSLHDPQFRSDLWVALKQLRSDPSTSSGTGNSSAR
ncbi:MAG TPA: helix-turn-helix domain-containing protein, partial [Homoserinimonas sp.]|nr:helix-turn-helix domain-containing protein [Homoserinimonas sp.]